MSSWFRRIFKPIQYEQMSSHGTERWAVADDLAEEQLLYRLGAALPPGALSLGRFDDHHQIVLNRAQACCHVLVLGPSGTGKSTSLLIPNILSYRGSMAVSDPKSELWNTTAHKHQRARRYAPLEPERSVPFNFVPRCKDVDIALLLGKALASADSEKSSDTFWDKAATSLYAALLNYTAHMPEATPATLYNLMVDLSRDMNRLVKVIDSGPSRAARELLTAFVAGPEKTKGSILATAAVNWTWMTSERVKRFTSSTLEPADFTELRSWPVACYWCLPKDDVERLKPLSTLFFTLLFNDVSKTKGPCPIQFFWDEIANIGRLPDFEKSITLVRGEGISFFLAIQDRAQINELYGNHYAKVIMGNCAHKVILHSCELEDTKWASELLGEMTIELESRTATRGANLVLKAAGLSGSETRGTTTSEKARALYTPAEIRRLPKDRALLISKNLPPVEFFRFYVREKKEAYIRPGVECPARVIQREFRGQ